MQFQFLPLLERMVAFYQRPLNRDRFEFYIQMMYDRVQQRDILKLPIPAYNPMAKPHVLERLQELQQLQAEDILHEAISTVNQVIEQDSSLPERIFRVGLVMADDLRGGWTDRYATDYQNRFNPRGIFNRDFCTPVFWSSETYTPPQVLQTCLAYIWRTVYQAQHPPAGTLLEHLQQEAFVNQQLGKQEQADEDFELVVEYLCREQSNEQPGVLYAFLYGDEAAGRLGHPPLGFETDNGFRNAQLLVRAVNQKLEC